MDGTQLWVLLVQQTALPLTLLFLFPVSWFVSCEKQTPPAADRSATALVAAASKAATGAKAVHFYHSKSL